jgi:hypothetical protein
VAESRPQSLRWPQGPQGVGFHLPAQGGGASGASLPAVPTEATTLKTFQECHFTIPGARPVFPKVTSVYFEQTYSQPQNPAEGLIITWWSGQAPKWDLLLETFNTIGVLAETSPTVLAAYIYKQT